MLCKFTPEVQGNDKAVQKRKPWDLSSHIYDDHDDSDGDDDMTMKLLLLLMMMMNIDDDDDDDQKAEKGEHDGLRTTRGSSQM